MEQSESRRMILDRASAERGAVYHQTISQLLTERRGLWERALVQLATSAESVAAAASVLVDTLRNGHKVLVAGNGGSAAEAQHFAAELVGRFQRDRAAFAAIALTADTSILTAVGNDYGFEQVFARQVFALGQQGDLFLAFSTSGESENVVRAALAARQRSMSVLAVTGEASCRLERLADITIHAWCPSAAVTQEIHMLVTHILCGIAETALCESDRVS